MSYTGRSNHCMLPLLVAAGGYGVALAAWELTHLAYLEAFILGNELPLDLRRTLAIGLALATGTSLVLWLVVGFVITKRKLRLHRWKQTAMLTSLGIVLPILPILALSGIRVRAPVLSVAGAAIVVVAVALVVRSLRSGGRSGEGSVAPTRSITQALEPTVEPVKRLDKAGLALTLGLTACYMLFMTALAIAQHNAYLTNAFDLGIHDQAIYNILHSGYMRTTLYGNYAIDYIGDHFSPALYLLAPFYALRQDARTLLALQSLLLGAAAIPLYLLARLKTRGNWLALAIVAAYLLHPALHGVNLDDFHQVALVPVFVLSALYFLEDGRDAPFLLFLALALLVKEEIALTVVAIGAYAVFAKGRHRLGLMVMGIGILYFFLVIGWVMPLLGGTPQIDKNFGEYIAPGTRGAAGVAWTLFTNPLFTVLHIIGNLEKMAFLLQVLLPVVLLPLLAPPVAWVVALPALAVQTLTTTQSQYSIDYHYTAHLLPLVFFLAVLALGRLNRAVTSRDAVGRSLLTIAIVVSSVSVAYFYSRALPRQMLTWPQPTDHDRVVDEFVAGIPQDATVSTLGGIVPHLSARKTIYLFPDVGDAEYLLVDTDLDANYWPYEGLGARDRSLASMTGTLRAGTFGLVRAEDGVFLFRRGADTSNNRAALRQMLSTRYEAEALRTDFERPVSADVEASGGKARAVAPQDRRDDGKAALLYGPYTNLQPGNYRATFYLKANDVAPDARVATLDVFTHQDGYPRAVREVYGRDFSASPGYRAFVLDFNTSGQALEDVEFRVTYDFVGELWIDRVDLEFLD